MQITTGKINILYVFGGEKALGAEIVMERLMSFNINNVNTHLILSPGKFADDLIHKNKPYQITLLSGLKKLNRANTGKIEFYTKAIKNHFSVSYAVYRYIKKNNIQIVHANTMVPASYLLPLTIYSRVFLRPVKWLWSDHDLKYFSDFEMNISKLCTRLFDNTIVVSNAVKRKYHTLLQKVIVLYNGLDVELFKPSLLQRETFRNKLNIDESVIVIGISAGINPDKGQLSLIYAFNKLSKIHPGIRLILAGDYASQFPEYAADVKSAIQQNDKIIYAGFLDDIISFYNGCDIIINNSNRYRSESLGTSIYEAMACEKIVVASDTGGTPEIISNNNDGFLFETENQDALFQRLDYVINNYKLLGAVRRAARDKVKEKFDIHKMQQQYNGLLNSL